jgi:endonuclease/exonuclease/phosphatase family metal-dependent hydrolase
MAAGCQSARTAGPADRLTIMSYNVLYGFDKGKGLDAGTRWIAKQRPDVLALQELNGFTPAKLAEAARRWGHEHAVILKEDGFPVGLTSRFPIEVIERRVDRGADKVIPNKFWHGYLHAKVAGVHYIVVHLSPSNYQVRRYEVAQLGPKIKALIAAGEHVVVLGDFNTHHPADRESLETRPDVRAGRAKGPIDLIDGQIDFTVMRAFMDTGLEDVCLKLIEPSKRIGSIPSRLAERAPTPELQAKLFERIDYILMSPRLAARCASAAIPHDEVLNTVSDHYPVIVKVGRAK